MPRSATMSASSSCDRSNAPSSMMRTRYVSGSLMSAVRKKPLAESRRWGLGSPSTMRTRGLGLPMSASSTTSSSGIASPRSVSSICSRSTRAGRSNSSSKRPSPRASRVVSPRMSSSPSPRTMRPRLAPSPSKERTRPEMIQRSLRSSRWRPASTIARFAVSSVRKTRRLTRVSS